MYEKITIDLQNDFTFTVKTRSNDFSWDMKQKICYLSYTFGAKTFLNDNGVSVPFTHVSVHSRNTEAYVIPELSNLWCHNAWELELLGIFANTLLQQRRVSFIVKS